MIEHLQEAHQAAKAQYGKIAERFTNLDAVRQQLQSLRDLGDMVDQDDVIRSASHLVGKGLTPAGLAGLLADMPKEGEALAGWVGNLWQFMLQREMQMKPLLQHARTQLGTSALQLLSGQHLQHRIGELQAAGAMAAPQEAAAEPPQPDDQGPPDSEPPDSGPPPDDSAPQGPPAEGDDNGQ